MSVTELLIANYLSDAPGKLQGSMPCVVSTFPVMDSGFLNPIQGSTSSYENHSLPIPSNSERESEAFSSISFKPVDFCGIVGYHYIGLLTFFLITFEAFSLMQPLQGVWSMAVEFQMWQQMGVNPTRFLFILTSALVQNYWNLINYISVNLNAYLWMMIMSY